MINEPGQPPQKCRVVREWTLPDGDKAMEAEDVATGQKITLVTPAPDGRSKTVAARFFHWGKDGTPPRGTPLPPPTAFAQGTPALPPAALTAGPPPAATAQTAASGQKLPLSLAPQTTTAGNAWPPAFGGSGPAAATAAAPAPPPASSYQAKPVPPAIITTSATSPAPAAAPPTPVTTTPAPVAAAPTPASSYQTAPAPAPPTMVVTPPPAGRLCPVPSTCCPPCGTNRGCPRNTCCPPTVVSGPPVIINTQPAPTTPASQPVGLPVVSTVPAQPGDWRRSWGASRDPKPAADGSPVITQTASV
ncbi:MAG TPA: hypothetical protein VFA26_21125, partial [Gemmataceae bacterium]|nr:hypothetical protein [Gemmataceae bacterium]